MSGRLPDTGNLVTTCCSHDWTHFGEWVWIFQMDVAPLLLGDERAEKSSWNFSLPCWTSANLISKCYRWNGISESFSKNIWIFLKFLDVWDHHNFDNAADTFSLSTSELFRTQSNSPTLLNLQRTAQVLNLHVGEMFKLEFLKFMYFCCSLRYINTVALPYLISSRPRERAQASGTFFRSLNSQY